MPSKKILPHLWKIREYFSKTNRAKNLDAIASYFRELEEHTEVLESKCQPDNSAFASAECFVNTRSMIGRLLKKIHKKIMTRLKETPCICTPWRGSFSIDVTLEVFDVLLKKVTKRNSFEHVVKDTKSLTEVSLNDLRKAVYILHRQNMDGQIISKGEIGCKKAGELKQTKLVVRTSKPFVLKGGFYLKLLFLAKTILLNFWAYNH